MTMTTSWRVAISDDEVLKACGLELSTEDDRRLTELLQRQQAQTLAVSEQAELASLMQVYQEGLVRKAEALREAVRQIGRAHV